MHIYSDCVAGNDYIILNIRKFSDGFTLTNDTLLYIDRLTADENGVVETTVLPGIYDPDSVVVLIGDFGNGTEAKVITQSNFETTYDMGDLNGDGTINSSDTLLVLRHSVGSIVLEEKSVEVADVNKDTRINSSDALMILQYAVGLIERL